MLFSFKGGPPLLGRAAGIHPVKVVLGGNAAPPFGATVYVLPEGLGGVQGVPVIKLPTSALWQTSKTTAVWVLKPTSMTVKAQSVQIATADGNDVVISSGLQPGMLVVSAGVHVLSPGQKVTIYKEKVSLALENIRQEATNSRADNVAAPAPVVVPVVVPAVVPAASATAAR